VRGLLLGVLSGVLFLAAVSCAVFAMLVRGHERRYLSWVALAAWAVLCMALAVVLAVGFLL